jgi:ABC-type cobalamin transport system ATPase subunit
MTPAELAMRYRRYAADCYSIAQLCDDPGGKLSALETAVAWLDLAQQSAKNQALAAFCETRARLRSTVNRTIKDKKGTSAASPRTTEAKDDHCSEGRS